jgi:HEAT repeat protein
MQTLKPDAHLAVPLVEALSDPSSSVREQAARTLGQVAGQYDVAVRKSVQPPDDDSYLYRGPGSDVWLGWQQSVADALARACADGDERVRREAARSLARLSDDVRNVFYMVVRCGAEDDWLLWIKAERSLYAVAKARPAVIVNLLSDRDPQVVYNASFSVASHAEGRVMPQMRRFLTHPKPEWRAIGVRILASRDPMACVPLLSDSHEAVRHLAVDLLGRRKEVLAALAPGFRVSSPLLRRSLLMVARGHEEWLPHLLGYGLEDPDPEVRADAIHISAEAKRPLRGEYLMASLQQGDARIRTAAIAALAEQEGEAACPVLLQTLNDRDESVREAAMSGLVRYPRPEVLEALVQAFHRSSREESFLIECALAEGGEETRGIIDRLLSDRDWRLRAMAVSAAWISPHPRREEIPISALKDPHPGVCIRAAWMVDDARGKELLAKMRVGTDRVARANALAALAYVGDRPALSELEGLVQSDDKALVMGAKNALAALEGMTGRVRP